MINAVHLIWIIPSCVFVGMLITAFFVGAAVGTNEYEVYQEGFKEGYKTAKEGCKQS